MIVIGRPINGITLNPLEFLLDDDGNERLFDSLEEAMKFLLDQGVYQFDHLSFIDSETREVT